MKMYRLIYRDGSVGAWGTDYNRIKKCAILFNALRIEEKEFNI